MVLKGDQEIKKALESRRAEYKVMQRFWNKNWEAKQQYYKVKDEDILKDLDVYAQKEIQHQGQSLKFQLKLQMHVSVKLQENFTFVGIENPGLIKERVIEIYTPFFPEISKNIPFSWPFPGTPSLFLDKSHNIFIQKDERSSNFTNRPIWKSAWELFKTWYAPDLYGRVKWWVNLSLKKEMNTEIIDSYESYLLNWQVNNEGKIPGDKLREEFLTDPQLNHPPTIYLIIRVPLLVVASGHCRKCVYDSKTESFDKFEPINWVKCDNYIFLLDNDKVPFGFYFMPIENLSSFIEKFEEHAQDWLSFFVNKEKMFLDNWFWKLADKHFQELEHGN
ncbi:MAG: hypothetical protein ACFFC7_30155 [Candidatus Hermodarchaeota archaeon]